MNSVDFSPRPIETDPERKRAQASLIAVSGNLAQYSQGAAIAAILAHQRLLTRDHEKDREAYASAKVKEVTNRRRTIVEYQGAGFCVGILLTVVIEMLFTFIFQPGQWLFPFMPFSQAILAFGGSVVLIALAGGGIGYLVGTRMGHYHDFRQRRS